MPTIWPYKLIPEGSVSVPPASMVEKLNTCAAYGADGAASPKTRTMTGPRPTWAAGWAANVATQPSSPTMSFFMADSFRGAWLIWDISESVSLECVSGALQLNRGREAYDQESSRSRTHPCGHHCRR